MKVATVLTLMALACAGCSGAASDRPAGDDEGSEQSPAVQRVVTELAAELGVAASELAVTAREEVVWPSAALGCPEPGKMYAQATTPGWRLTVTGPGEVSRQVHASEDGSYWVICERGHRAQPGES